MFINKAVYTATPVAGGWAGAVMSWAGAVMSWAGALTSMIYSYLHFSTFKQLKNAKKAKCDRTDRQTDRPTDRPTQWLIGRVARDKNLLSLNLMKMVEGTKKSCC